MANTGDNLTVHLPSPWREEMKGRGKISGVTLTLPLSRRGGGEIS
jgi:hypothetical protein